MCLCSCSNKRSYSIKPTGYIYSSGDVIADTGLKYRIILFIVMKNPWKYLLTYFLLRGAAPYPAGALTAPLRPQLVATFCGSHIENLTRSASTVSPSSDQSGVERWRHLTGKMQRRPKHRIWRNATLLIFFSRKKQRTIKRKKLSRGRGLAACMRIQIDSMIAVEWGAPG